MVPTLTTPIVTQVVEALERLAGTPIWLEMLSENILYKGGIERFFHRSFLWAFNTVSEPRYWAEPERRIPPLSGNEGIDLLLYENNPANLHDVWSGTLSDEGWLSMGRAFVEMKDNWSRTKIQKDVERLRLIGAAASMASNAIPELYVFLLIGNYFHEWPEEECVRKVINDETEMRRIVQDLGVSPDSYVAEKWFLQGERNPSDRMATTYFKISVARL